MSSCLGASGQTNKIRFQFTWLIFISSLIISYFICVYTKTHHDRMWENKKCWFCWDFSWHFKCVLLQLISCIHSIIHLFTSRRLIHAFSNTNLFIQVSFIFTHKSSTQHNTHTIFLDQWMELPVDFWSIISLHNS